MMETSTADGCRNGGDIAVTEICSRCGGDGALGLCTGAEPAASVYSPSCASCVAAGGHDRRCALGSTVVCEVANAVLAAALSHLCAVTRFGRLRSELRSRHTVAVARG